MYNMERLVIRIMRFILINQVLSIAVPINRYWNTALRGTFKR